MNDLSRRKFLEDSMLAAVAAMTVPAASAFAAEEPKKASANDKLSVAIVGVNGRGGSHIGAFAGKSDTEVTYIVDVDVAVGNRACENIEKKQGRRPKFVQDMREMLEDKSVDIVTTATPNHWHALTAIWAIQAGKDVYVEKPVSHNVSEGRRIVEAARKYKRICQTGTQCRSMPATIAAIEHIHTGKIGEMKLARGLCYKTRGSIGARGNYEVPDGVNYDLWCGPAPMTTRTRPKMHYDWHWQWDYGNGDLGNQGIHQMDVARWGLGASDLGDGVLSYGGRYGYEDAGETANTQVCIHTFGDKTLVFEVRGLKTEDLRGARVGNIFYGSQGYVVMTSYNKGAAFDPEGKMVKEFGGPGGDELHFQNFLKAVRSRNHKDLNADIEEGHLSSALCHLGNISYRLGSPMMPSDVRSALAGNAEATETFERFSSHLSDNKVDLEKDKITFGAKLKVDGKKENFPGNDKANAMLTREYRAPYIVPAAGEV
jgi:predicted dehydrogenase